MNRLLNSTAARAAAFVLTVALLMALCAGLVGVAALVTSFLFTFRRDRVVE